MPALTSYTTLGLLQGLGGAPSYSQLVVYTILLAITGLVFNLLRKPLLPKNAPELTRDSWPILGSLSFFTKRWDFYQRSTRQSKTGSFAFYVGKYPVIALSGEEQRKTFFEHGGLAFAEGYETLLAGAPQAKENNNVLANNNAGNGGFIYYFQKRLVQVLKEDQLSKLLPQILRDTRAGLDAVAAKTSGVTDPFDSIYRMVFHMSVRTMACKEIAEDGELRERFLGLFETIEDTGTPLSIIFPWLPLPSKASRAYAGVQLYRIVQNVVEERKRCEHREDDALQFLIDKGDTVVNIISFILGALFVGQVNSGINIAFILCYLAQKQDWLARIREEVNEVADRYCPGTSFPLRDRLMRVPVEAWESQFPIIDICLKDTIRLQMSGSAFRRNMSGKDIPLGNAGTEVIPKGTYVTLAAGDMHYNPEIYTEPDDWDPARYLPGREEDKKQVYAWMGWGLARHPCLGMRFAKLETNVIVALFLAYFNDIRLCDKRGNPVERVPPCSRNNYTSRKPEHNLCLKITAAA